MYDLLSSLNQMLHSISPWLVGLIKFAILLTAMETGFRAGRKKSAATEDLNPKEENLLLVSTFALLGLIFAFTFSAAMQRHENFKTNLVNEANTIGTAFLHADVAAEPARANLKRILIDYAYTRVAFSDSNIVSDQQLIELSQQSLMALWPATVAAYYQEPQLTPAERMSLFKSIIDVFDSNNIRNSYSNERLPIAMLFTLLLISVVALLAAGYNLGLSGKINRTRHIVFTAILALIMVLITDYDRPREGFIRVNQASMLGTITDMEAGYGGAGN